jgi:16S rRNA G1207 methylase RsmC
MPILDIFENEIAHHINFPNDLEITNIEFGAGRNFYGKKEYPKCYLTDLSYPELGIVHFKQKEDYNSTECHFLDNICDFYEFNFQRTFENIILCNPYHYGFNGLGNAKKFFERAGELLSEDGRIHIIGSSFNKWCCKDSLDDYFENEIEIYKTEYNFILEDYCQLTRHDHINTSYDFYKTELKDRTIPNEKLVIKKV